MSESWMKWNILLVQLSEFSSVFESYRISRIFTPPFPTALVQIFIHYCVAIISDIYPICADTVYHFIFQLKHEHTDMADMHQFLPSRYGVRCRYVNSVLYLYEPTVVSIKDAQSAFTLRNNGKPFSCRNPFPFSAHNAPDKHTPNAWFSIH